MPGEHILIVDDERAIQTTLRGVLEDEGYRVTAVGSGEQALARLQDDAPDIIFLDIWMPGIDGLDTLAEMKRLRPELAVVMISGHGTIETAVKATKLGAYDFIEKPLSLEKTLLDRHPRPRAHPARAREPQPARPARARPGDRRQEPAHRAPAPADRGRGALERPGAHPGRERLRQGAGGPRGPRPVRAARGALRRGQLRRDPRGADRVRAVRPRARRLHRRGRAPARQVRAGRPGHALPRRDRRHEPQDPGQGAAGAGGAGLRAGRRQGHDPGGRAGAGRLQPEPARAHRGGRVPGGSLSTG